MEWYHVPSGGVGLGHPSRSLGGAAEKARTGAGRLTQEFLSSGLYFLREIRGMACLSVLPNFQLMDTQICVIKTLSGIVIILRYSLRLWESMCVLQK